MKNTQQQVGEHFRAFMQRETLFEPRLVGWFTDISHQTIYHILRGRKPAVLQAARLIEFMEMIYKMHKLWRSLVEGWEGESVQVIDAGLRKLEGEMPAEISLEKFADIILSDHSVSKKVQILTAAILKGKKKCEMEKPSYKKLKEQLATLEAKNARR